MAPGFAFAPGFALPVGFALARGLALPISGLALGAVAFLGEGRLLLAAVFLAAVFLAADFLAGAFSGLVLGSGYVSAWVPIEWAANDMPSGWNNESDAKGFGVTVQGPRCGLRRRAAPARRG